MLITALTNVNYCFFNVKVLPHWLDFECRFKITDLCVRSCVRACVFNLHKNLAFYPKRLNGETQNNQNTHYEGERLQTLLHKQVSE